MSVVTCFLRFSEDDVRVLASSSFQLFLVSCGMPGKEITKEIASLNCEVTSQRVYVVCVRLVSECVLRIYPSSKGCGCSRRKSHPCHGLCVDGSGGPLDENNLFR